MRGARLGDVARLAGGAEHGAHEGQQRHGGGFPHPVDARRDDERDEGARAARPRRRGRPGTICRNGRDEHGHEQRAEGDDDEQGARKAGLGKLPRGRSSGRRAPCASTAANGSTRTRRFRRRIPRAGDRRTCRARRPTARAVRRSGWSAFRRRRTSRAFGAGRLKLSHARSARLGPGEETRAPASATSAGRQPRLRGPRRQPELVDTGRRGGERHADARQRDDHGHERDGRRAVRAGVVGDLAGAPGSRGSRPLSRPAATSTLSAASQRCAESATTVSAATT